MIKYIIIYTVLLVYGCSHKNQFVSEQKVTFVSEQKITRVETDKYIIIKENKIIFIEDLVDTNLSIDGKFLFKGLKKTPFYPEYNIPEIMHIDVSSNEKVEIFLFHQHEITRKLEYCGKIKIKQVNEKEIILVKMSDLSKVFSDGSYMLVLIKNDVPKLKYGFNLPNR